MGLTQDWLYLLLGGTCVDDEGIRWPEALVALISVIAIVPPVFFAILTRKQPFMIALTVSQFVLGELGRNPQ